MGVFATDVVHFTSLHSLTLTFSCAADLLTVWLSIKILTLGRVLFGAARVFGEQSPLAAKHGSRDDDD
jgi:hypothetical protein